MLQVLALRAEGRVEESKALQRYLDEQDRARRREQIDRNLVQVTHALPGSLSHLYPSPNKSTSCR